MTFPGHLFQCSDALNVKFFLMLRWNFVCYSLWPLLVVLSLGTTEASVTPNRSGQPRGRRGVTVPPWAEQLRARFSKSVGAAPSAGPCPPLRAF